MKARSATDTGGGACAAAAAAVCARERAARLRRDMLAGASYEAAPPPQLGAEERLDRAPRRDGRHPSERGRGERGGVPTRGGGADRSGRRPGDSAAGIRLGETEEPRERGAARSSGAAFAGTYAGTGIEWPQDRMRSMAFIDEDGAYVERAESPDIEQGARPRQGRDVSVAIVKHKRRQRLTLSTKGALGITKKFTRAELQQFFLEKVGVPIDDQSLAEIFAEVAGDRKNLISAQDLVEYTRKIEPRTRRERMITVVYGTVLSITFWCMVLFLVGSVIFIQLNLRSRPTGDLFGVDTLYSMVGCWCCTIGSFGFVMLVVNYERNCLEQRLLTKQNLAKILRWDLPRFFEEQINARHAKLSNLYSGGTNPGPGCPCAHPKRAAVNGSNPHTRPNRSGAYSIGAFFGSLRRGSGAMWKRGSHIRPSLSTFVELQRGGGCSDIVDARRTVFPSIAKFCIVLECMGVFLGYDELQELFREIDADGSGDFSLQEIMDFAEANRERPSEREEIQLVSKSCARNIGFWTSWGYLLGSALFIVADCVEGDELIKHLTGVGCSLFLVAALGDMHNLFNSVRRFCSFTLKAETMLRGAAIKLGMSMVDVGRSETSFWNDKEMKSFQCSGAREILRCANIGRNDKLDKATMSRILLDLGVFMPYANFDAIFKEMDASGDGAVQAYEFVSFVKNIKPCTSEKERKRVVFRIMLREISFYLEIIRILSGCLQVFATYKPLDYAKADLFLAGSFGWLCSGLYGLEELMKAKQVSFDQKEQNKFLLKEAVDFLTWQTY